MLPTRRRPMAEINVVPYVDVMLVLLVIFMVTAPLLSQGVLVELPQAAAENLEPKAEPPIIVTVDNKGLFYLNVAQYPEQALTDEQLLVTATAVLQQDNLRTVLVRADKNVAYGSVMAAMVLLQRAGAPKVGLVTETPIDES